MVEITEYDEYEEGSGLTEEVYDETGTRNTWAVLTWIILALTLTLNLILIIILIVKRNLNSITNKLIFVVAISDLLYGCFVSPFFVENYVRTNWEQGIAYCSFYTFFFTFHDLFAPLCLIVLSIYISLKFTGVTAELKHKRLIYAALAIGVTIISLLLSIPATLHAGVFLQNDGQFRQECRSFDVYTMLISYSIFSSLLFCFTFSFLFSLCILGSPLLRDVYDPDEHTQRWRLLLTISLVNIFYIISGFLLNFKELSRFLFSCCLIKSPLEDINNITYDVWNFVLLALEPTFRPLVYLTFYLSFLMTNDNIY
jgi:flagellar biogenesis protein FliO